MEGVYPFLWMAPGCGGVHHSAHRTGVV